MALQKNEIFGACWAGVVIIFCYEARKRHGITSMGLYCRPKSSPSLLSFPNALKKMMVTPLSSAHDFFTVAISNLHRFHLRTLPDNLQPHSCTVNF
jgi:hypothetical protein